MDIEAFKNLIIPVPEDPDKINTEACKKCSQNAIPCCMCLPCYLSPDDIVDKSYQGICNLIETGLISLDWWEGDPRITTERSEYMTDEQFMYKGFFLRIRAQNAPIVHPAFSKWQCVLYSPDKGCALPYTHRPKGSRELLPPQCKANPSSECRSMYEKQECAVDWIPYHDVLQQVYVSYKDALDGVTTPDGLREERLLEQMIDLLLNK